jgi:ABC-type hemin transport system ATPase subunit
MNINHEKTRIAQARMDDNASRELRERDPAYLSGEAHGRFQLARICGIGELLFWQACRGVLWRARRFLL